MSCSDQSATYRAAETALAESVVARDNARAALVTAEENLAAAQAVVSDATAAVDSAQTDVASKAAIANSAHDAWIECIIGA